MKDINGIIAIENHNKAYLDMYHSNGMRLIRNITTLKNSNFKDLCRLIKKRKDIIIGDLRIKRNVNNIKRTNEYYVEGEPLEGVKVAVYTCITSGYDVAKQPVYRGEDTDYFVFTDLKKEKNSIWKEKEIDYINYTQDANRYYKFHPFEHFLNYDFAIYIDGNVQIISDVTTLCSIARKSKVGIAMHTHHCRNCAYEEAKTCLYYKRGNKEKIIEQVNKFKQKGLPYKFGLKEATIIVYDLKNQKAKNLVEQWWDEYINSGSKRDQLAFPYIIWKNGLDMNDVGDLGNNLWTNPKFVIYGHS